jgi:hypothetical protein
MLMSMVLKKKTLKIHKFENACLSIPCYLTLNLIDSSLEPSKEQIFGTIQRTTYGT